MRPFQHKTDGGVAVPANALRTLLCLLASLAMLAMMTGLASAQSKPASGTQTSIVVPGGPMPANAVVSGTGWRCVPGYARRGETCVRLVVPAYGYVMASFGYPLVIVIIAFFLGPRLEVSIAQSLALSGGDPAALLGHPVAIGLLLLSVVSAVYLVRRTRLAAG